MSKTTSEDLAESNRLRLNEAFAQEVLKKDGPPIDLEKLEKLRAKGANIDEAMFMGSSRLSQTPLSYAASKKNLALLEWLLEKGARPNTDDVSTRQPLHLALRDAWPEGAEKILSYKPDLSGGEIQRSDLILAILHGFEQVAIAMIELGVPWKTEPEDHFSQSPLFFAVRENAVSLLATLQEKGEDLQMRKSMEVEGSRVECGLVSVAAYHGAWRTLPILLEQGLKPEDSSFPPLCAAAIKGHPSLLLSLLSHGANPNQAFRGLSPLIWAAQKNNDDCMSHLLEEGVDIRAFVQQPELTFQLRPLEEKFKTFLSSLTDKKNGVIHAVRSSMELEDYTFTRKNKDVVHPICALFETWQGETVERASPILRQLAGAGMLPELFAYADWKHRDAGEAIALSKRIEAALPSHYKNMALEIDVIWAQAKLPETWTARTAPPATLSPHGRR